MEVQSTKTGEIRPYEKNAKRHNAAQIGAVAASITEFGFNQPIVVDKKGVIIVGHARYEAALQLGLEEVPVLTLDLSEEQARAYRLADNKLNESPWDIKLVIEELKQLSAPLLDLTGFERTLILGKALNEDDAPDTPAIAKSVLGDLYELGPHRIYCGDSTKQEDVALLMNGRKADLLLTDPPYNVDYTGKSKKALKIENDSKSDADYSGFLVLALTHATANLKEGGSFYLWHADLEGYSVRGACATVGLDVRQCLIWNKNSMVLGRQDYHWKHEPCLYGWKEGAAHFWNSDRTQVTVLNFDRPSRSEKHPTMKPVELLAYQINNSSKAGDIVLDPFLGSGSTLIAAQKMGRECYGMELDPRYVDVIVQRYVEYIGNKEIKKNGEPILW